jgi:hypothetical protein
LPLPEGFFCALNWEVFRATEAGGGKSYFTKQSRDEKSSLRSAMGKGFGHIAVVVG